MTNTKTDHFTYRVTVGCKTASTLHVRQSFLRSPGSQHARGGLAAFATRSECRRDMQARASRCQTLVREALQRRVPRPIPLMWTAHLHGGAEQGVTLNRCQRQAVVRYIPASRLHYPS